MEFALTLPPLPLGLLAAALLLMLLGTALSEWPWRLTARHDDPPLPPEDTPLPRASVVVICTRTDDEYLPLVLQNIYAQDYPDFEVIVVCDTTAEGAEMLTEKYSRQFPGLYLTFTPPGSHNLSRKKLALTIGIKAAKGDVVLTTSSNIYIPSDQWLRRMMAPFTRRGVDIVLGYSKLDFDEMKGPWKWYRQFDDVLCGARWIGYALGGSPYRGDGNNLAFRRELFFAHKGFASSNYLHSGEDDIFVSEIATGRNTALSLSPESIVTALWGDSANRVWSIRKATYDFTARWLPRGPFWRAGFGSLCRWLVVGLCVAAAIAALPNLVGAIAALLILLLYSGIDIYYYRKTARRLEAVRLFWALPIFLLLRPLVNALFRLDHRESNRKLYTWQR